VEFGLNQTSGTPVIINASVTPALQSDVAAVSPPATATNLPLVPYMTSDTDTGESSYIPFSVTPASGQIAAGATAEILVKFSPLDVSEYHACLYARLVSSVFSVLY